RQAGQRPGDRAGEADQERREGAPGRGQAADRPDPRRPQEGGRGQSAPGEGREGTAAARRRGGEEGRGGCTPQGRTGPRAAEIDRRGGGQVEGGGSGLQRRARQEGQTVSREPAG